MFSSLHSPSPPAVPLPFYKLRQKAASKRHNIPQSPDIISVCRSCCAARVRVRSENTAQSQDVPQRAALSAARRQHTAE